MLAPHKGARAHSLGAADLCHVSPNRNQIQARQTGNISKSIQKTGFQYVREKNQNPMIYIFNKFYTDRHYAIK